jgi:23S rRNA (guanosine2251-2'-O)-methyltransferase
MLPIYGRIPVVEALSDPAVRVELVLLARTARGDTVDDIVRLAGERGIPLKRVAPEKVTRVSGNGRHDQGVVAEVEVPGLVELREWLGSHSPRGLLVLDGVTNPQNVGMIVRTATGAGLDGVVLPRAGVPDVGPLVVKASAGVALRATILSCDTAEDGVRALADAGLRVVGMRAGALSIFDGALPDRAAYVLGSEHAGVSPAVAGLVHEWRSIPLANDVESLNVAVAAGVLAYEIARRSLSP